MPWFVFTAGLGRPFDLCDCITNTHGAGDMSLDTCSFPSCPATHTLSILPRHPYPFHLLVPPAPPLPTVLLFSPPPISDQSCLSLQHHPSRPYVHSPHHPYPFHLACLYSTTPPDPTSTLPTDYIRPNLHVSSALSILFVPSAPFHTILLAYPPTSPTCPLSTTT